MAIKVNLAGLDMHGLIEQVLPFRSFKHVESFCEKLVDQGVRSPEDLLKVSKEALETKLSTHGAFNFIEMADAVSLRDAIDPNKKNGSSSSRGKRRSRTPRRRNKSRESPHRRSSRNNSKRGGRHNHGGPRSRHGNKQQAKPELWLACERNDAEAAEQMLLQGKNIEEKFQGCTPLMKAAEEDSVDCLRLLIEKKANLEATNRRGRTALSFAAAPSANNSDGNDRPTALEALRILLEHGAVVSHTDDTGKTAKERAKAAERDDAIAILEEFGA